MTSLRNIVIFLIFRVSIFPKRIKIFKFSGIIEERKVSKVSFVCVALKALKRSRARKLSLKKCPIFALQQQ